MKAPAFDYIKPRQLDEVFALLQQYGDEARVIAGGQSLVAALNLRLSQPALLVDITGLPGLSAIEVRGERLHIGALVTHSAIEASALVAEHAPLLAAAAPHIAHRAIRNAGTWGGSIANADPSAEWPCCLLALDGVVTVLGAAGERRIAAIDFFKDLYTTALRPGEIVTGADVPLATRDDAQAFDELARRHGDYAVAGLALVVRFDGTAVRQARIGLLGMGSTPLRAPQTEALLAGKALDAATVEIAAASLRAELSPYADLHHSAETKRHLAGVLLRRLLSATQAGRAALKA